MSHPHPVFGSGIGGPFTQHVILHLEIECDCEVQLQVL